MEYGVEQINEARDYPIYKLVGLDNPRFPVRVRCPFHAEKSPSCYIYRDNHWHCFGCGSHGFGAIDFIIGMGYTFKEAVNHIRTQ